MSGGREGGSARHTFLGRFIDSFRRPAPQVRQEQRPVEEDLGLKTLRNVYSQYIHTEEAADKERRLYTMLPLFLKNCSRLKGSELVTKFPECLEFSEHVALLFVRHVTQLAQMHGTRACEALLKFLEVENDEAGGAETGILMLKVLQVFSEGPPKLVDAMMSSDLSSILVRCVHLFLDLPPPTPPPRHRSTSGGGGASPMTPQTNTEHTSYSEPRAQHGQRIVLQKLLTGTLTHLCRHTSAVECLLQHNDMSLLFGAISSPCPPYNKIWRKAAADCLLAIFRHSLSHEVIHFVHTKGCIGFCIRNIQLSVDQPPLDLVEIFATLFCCLKDSTDISQVLVEDFAAHGGHKFLFDYLLYLERQGSDDAREAVRNMVFLISGLVTAGFHPVESAVTEVGPFQDEGFTLPKPTGPGASVRNVEIFLVLQKAFLVCNSTHLGKTILDTILSIYRSDAVNYFVLESQRTLTAFLEIIPQKTYEVQQHIFQLLEHVMVDLNYVPAPELTSLGLLLQKREYPKTICLGLNFFLRLISHTARYKDVFREVGILQVLVGALGAYVEDLRENEEEEVHPDPHGDLASPSLPLQELQGDTEEYIFLLIECLRATIEGNTQNGQVFRECGGSRLTLELVTYRKPRRMALRLITQLILLPDGSVDLNSLLDQLNCSAQTAVSIKSEILRTVLGVFQLDSQKKAVFREVCGFHYLISTLASLIGSLAPRRSTPWVGVPRSEVLKLVQLVFVVLMSAMQDDPANKMFFETNIRFQSFTAPLLLLGCFSRGQETFPLSPEDDVLFSSPGFQTFEAEFKTWQQPGEKLDENSFVFSAAEVFRFLRDMALDVPMTQSTSLLQVKARKSVFRCDVSRLTAGHLVHPGAVLCMVDLLPSVSMSTQSAAEDEKKEKEIPSGLAGTEDTTVPLEDVPNQSGVVVAVNGETTEDHGETKQCHCDHSQYGEDCVEAELRQAMEGGNEKTLEKNYCKMSPSEAKMWCVFLQERVVTEIFSMAMTERNQQALCQVYLPQRILQRCGAVLSDEIHPLHQSLERTFERLSYQALTPSDFRNFLRLGDPLYCTVNDITIDQLESVGNGTDPISDLANPCTDPQTIQDSNQEAISTKQPPLEETTLALEKIGGNQKKKYGGSLSLARIQSLVTMTTPRSSTLSNVLGNPSFIEIDHSIDGFGCLFLPSVFPQPINLIQPAQNSVQSPSAVGVSTSGVGFGGERMFPPNSGLTFSCWLYISSITADDETPFSLLSLSHNFLGVDKKIASVPCFTILANFTTEIVTVTLQSSKKEQLLRDSSVTEDHKSDRVDTVSFPCPQLGQLQTWHHVVVTVAKTLRQKSRVSLFVDGLPLGVQKMAYIRPVVVLEGLSYDSTPYLINAHIGTHVSQRHVSNLLIRLGPMYMFDDHISPQTAGIIHKLGPSYFGSFQAPVIGDTSLLSLMSPRSSGDPLPPLVPEERVVFGLTSSHPSVKTICELSKTYSTVDTATIAGELQLSEGDDVTPVQLLHDTSFHLYGPSRTLGAVMCGFSGIRSFQPQPLRDLLSSVGGTSVMLGLVAMATSVDALYASMKALVCIVGNNQVALKEMERTGGFQVLGMLLRSKNRLINSNILHLTFTLVGTVDSEHESACIPNPIAFRDLLADLSVWSGTSEDIQRSLLAHFFDLLTHTRKHSSNTSHMQDMKLVWLLLFRIHDNHLSRATIKSICNVINAILGSSPTLEDIRRVCQLMVTTLAHRHQGNENDIDIYTDTPPSPAPSTDPQEGSETQNENVVPQLGSDSQWEEEGEKGEGEGEGEYSDERRCHDIVLRNMLMDMLLSLFSSAQMELNTRFAVLVSEAVGLDWVLLFLHANTHTDTVSRALRLLVQLLSIERLQQRFHEGEIFGPWVKGFENLPPDISTLLETSMTQVNPLKPQSQFPLPGAPILSRLLPHHLHSPQVFLLMIAFLLGKTGLSIPFSASFTMETLDNVFQVGDTVIMTNVRLCPDAAFVLLAMARVLLHQTPGATQATTATQAPVELLVKFLERLYRTLPLFCSVANSQEFIEALAATLFPLPLHPAPPPPPSNGGPGGREGDQEEIAEIDDEEYVLLVRDSEFPAYRQQLQHDSQAALLRVKDVAVCSIIQLLRTIAVDGFALTQPTQRDQKPVCHVLELVLSAGPSSASLDLQNKYQTRILNSILDHLQVGNEDVTVIFHSAASHVFTRAMIGLGVFCSRLVDKLWQGVYQEPSVRVYNFLISLVEQALRQPNVLPLGELYRSLNRVILYQLSTVPSTEKDQKALMETLCMYSGQAHVIFDDTNVDSEFLECVTYRLLQVMFSGTRQSPDETKERWSTSYQPMAQSVMKSGANRLWQKMLEKKHDSLQALLSVELPVPTSGTAAVVSVINTAATSSYPNIPPATPPPPPTSLSPPSVTVPSANSQFLRLQGCQPLMTQALTKAWDSYLVSERNTPGLDSISRSSRGSEKKSLLRASVSRRKEKEIVKHSTVEGIVKEYVEVLCPLLISAAVKYEDMITLKHKRNMEYRLRFTVQEWSRIEWELTRERGLWGPDHPSPLDKWMLDTVEGPHRMRKRMCRNHMFYYDYPFDLNAPISNKKSKHQRPTSAHSKLHFTLKSMFQQSNLLSGTPSSNGNKPLPFALPSNDALLSMSIEYPSTGSSAHAPAFTTDAEDHPPPSPAHSKTNTMFPRASEDDPVAQAIAKMIEPDDEVVAKFQSARLTGLDSRDGVLLLGVTHFYVIEGVTLLNGELVDIESAPQGSYNPVLPGHLHISATKTEAVPIGCVKWPYTVVREIHKRLYLLRRCALEVFSSDGRNQFLIFLINQRDKLYQKLKTRCSNLAESGNDTVAGTHPDRDPEQATGLLSAFITGDKSPATRWANGEMSNFQYLMQLNTLAGRSYNDLMQYPIFPWVLADYTSQTLDLTNPATFRDFSLPMGAQSKERLQRFIDRYNLTKEDPTDEGIPPYYYGTHYSSAMIVASYLIRMEPFTGHFIKLQGGHFDLPDRLFTSIPVAWVSASSTNMADVKELIPEFFYLPEFLENSNHFDLGTKQSGEVLGDIVLPPWAKGCPVEFIRLHREALESDYVSAHLHEWIDLIFGYKQTGKEALKAHNVFYHLFYEGAVDVDKIDDPVEKGAALSFIHNFGQMPKQLFKKPHPSRKVFSYSANPSLSAPPVTVDTTRVFYKNLTQLMPSREPVKEIRGEVHHISLVGERNLLVLDRNKLPLPPLYSRYFMWGFPDRSARVASVEADKVLSVFENLHQGRILCSAMADDSLLLTGGDSTIVCVWEIKNTGSRDRIPVQLQLKHTLHGHTDAVTCIAASLAYNIIVSGSKDQTCIIWDINKMVFVRQLQDHTGPVTMTAINQSNGNIVSCTKSQICLWTVNGLLLASTSLLITGSFSLLCCAVSEMFNWDQDNVIVTGSSDGIVRMWIVEYLKEGETPKSPVKRKESNLDVSSKSRPASVIKKMRDIIRSARSSPAEHDDHDALQQEDLSLTDGGMSTDSEDDIYTTPLSTNTSREEEGEGEWEELDNPVYHTHVDHKTHEKSPQHAATTQGTLRNKTTPHLLTLPPNDMLPSSNVLSVTVPKRGRARSFEEIVAGEEKGNEPSSRRRSRSQPNEPVSLRRETQGETSGHREMTDGRVSSGLHVPDQPYSIPIKTQIGPCDQCDGNTETTGSGEAQQFPTSPVLTQCLSETKKKAMELREQTSKWTRRLTQVHQLTMHTSVTRKDNDSPAAVTSLHISRDHRRLFVGDSRGRVFSWTVSDTQGGVMEHWLRDEAVDRCRKCSVEFTFTERKHHCRDCGKIFCYRCSGFESEVKRLRIFKKVRVCEECYKNLQRAKQSPKI